MYTGPALAQIYVANNDDSTVSIFLDGPDTITVDLDLAPEDLVVSPDGDFVYVAGNDGSAGVVAVIQTSDNTVIATVDVGSFPTGIAITPDGSHLYVANIGGNNVSVIQTSDNTVVATVDVGNSPIRLAVTTDGDHVFVANSGASTVSVIQTSDNTVVATVDVDGSPFGITANAANSILPATVYVTSQDSNNICAYSADPPFSLVALGGEVLCADVGENPSGVAGTIINQAVLAFVANTNSNTVSIVEVNGNGVIGTTTVGQAPIGVVAGFLAESVYVINRDSNTMLELQNNSDDSLGSYTVVKTFDTGMTPVAIAMTQNVGLGDPDPDPMGDGNGSSSNSCALAPPGASTSFPLYLLIPAFILINRLWRRRTN